MPKGRKVDVMARGKGSLAHRLMTRRQLLESGKPIEAKEAMKPKRRKPRTARGITPLKGMKY